MKGICLFSVPEVKVVVSEETWVVNKKRKDGVFLFKGIL